MTFIARQEPFTCEHCEKEVTPLAHGSYRNHCPHCLYSKHVDDAGPGTRDATCHGLMAPAALDQDGKKGWMIVHTCVRCGKTIRNKAAPDDNLTVAGKEI